MHGFVPANAPVRLGLPVSRLRLDSSFFSLFA
jgi:hypothetical protein